MKKLWRIWACSVEFQSAIDDLLMLKRYPFYRVGRVFSKNNDLSINIELITFCYI
ncbi:hypothetical protein XBJ2_1820004 [Xenorhabdus bovienii str. Jollieti]|uniref:Uncharacterized protein n=1 Tax=Xenorhabdus bovienii (strain SS-2004) TaxID=406818 RepID=D3V4P1_XENBS|nr:hypothetical protein XBJ1_3502 [Xenorhabdus bovienii SS-2004]CDH28419.1 hypothetical protein XBJ2_1820004 [Xenorhabdus bovienii str. Jollieti]